jgi:hypothetical protein
LRLEPGAVGRHESYSHDRTLPSVLISNLGHAHREATSQTLRDRTENSALFLERFAIGEK